MLAGLFIQNYKCYSNINFIPLTNNPDRKLNVFIGPNGAGKSAILESLNCLLNNISPKEWETTLDKKKDRASICPVFLIPKSDFGFDAKTSAISDCFWNYDFGKLGNDKFISKFIELREELKKINAQDKYHLIAIGKDYNGNILLTTTFHNKILDQTRRHGTSKSFTQELYRDILDRYSYIYIPVENKISDILNLQAQEMQSLMDKKIIEDIKKLLDEKLHSQSSSTRKISLLDMVNSELNFYTQDINSRMSDGYEFQAKASSKKNIRSSDIIDIILKEYFHVRPLTKDGKHIKSLSSGQQRLALIDVATTLLSTYNEKSREVILAIDEPEGSLEPAHCFEQFSRLAKISSEYKRQLLITTHWYGLLLKPTSGTLNHVELFENKAPEPKTFPLQNIHEQRRSFPNSIEMKSYFDLMSSMLSLLKKTNYNWIICEGSEDAKYIEYYANEEILQKTIILPFNGAGNIKKLYEFLRVPLEDEKENKDTKGKVVCLIDNDEKNAIIINNYKSGASNKKLQFFRLHLDREKINLA